MEEYYRVPPNKLGPLMARFFARGPGAMVRAAPVQDLVAPTRQVPVGETLLRYHPTQLPLARWATENPRIMEQGIENFGIGEFVVRRITETFDINRIPIKPSPLFPQFGKVLATEDVLPRIQQEIPPDGTEIVEWMHDVTATNVVMTAREAEYNVHSQFVTSTGDGFIPGVRVSSMAFRSISGYSYASRGYATVISPAGEINVPRGAMRAIIGKDFLGWAYAGRQYGIQWKGALGQLVRLADRITQAVGFPNIDGKVAPFFILQQPSRETQRAIVRMVIDSDRDQTMKITFRDPNDYRRVIDEGEIEVPRGRSTIEFVVASYPAVPPVVNHMQPEDYTRTVLNSFEVRRG
ncbi:MAG: hypothetical protein J7K15_11730 [Deltaproteobacteria bacterium]|nr:hypothetical protein [Deltaproteobacteria bacterium]